MVKYDVVSCVSHVILHGFFYRYIVIFIYKAHLSNFDVVRRSLKNVSVVVFLLFSDIHLSYRLVVEHDALEEN